MKIGRYGEAVELPNAKAFAVAHLRESRSFHTLCGRYAAHAQVLSKLAEREFEPDDPDIRICRTCRRLTKFHRGILES